MTSEKLIKVRCPLCAGKISMEEGYYSELAGKAVNCPHCGKQIQIPTVIPITEKVVKGSHSVDRTQQIQKTSEMTRAVPPVPSRDRLCPFCGVKIGPRDLICVMCGARLSAPPA